ncbi:MAG: stage V sporulation protein D [Candidatus Aerophobus sp.]|nr:MAG: stage V sporulation protein D [Candidatus Aerophobus sp.]
MARKRDYRARIYLPFFLLFMALIILEGRLYDLQILNHQKFFRQASKGQTKSIKISPKRGSIYDRNLEKLAANIPSYSLYARPGKISHFKKVARKLSPIVRMKVSSLTKKLRQKKVFVWLKRKLSLAQKKRIEALGLKGIGFVEESKRFYPQGELASSLLGFAGVDNQGLAGVELSYNSELQGEAGHFWIREDALGYEIPFAKDTLQALVPGKNLVLTLDNVIQSMVEQELSLTLKKTKAKSVEALFMDPQTGEILALVNKPDYDPNHYSDYSPFTSKNRVVQSLYEPGSSFKSFTASALLQEGLTDLNEKIYCGESVRVANHLFHDWKNFDRDLSVTEIFENSSNVGVIELASRMKKEKFYKYIRLFGFGNRTGVDLPGEGKGIVRSPSDWSLTDLPAISIGQGIAVTPVQMVTVLSALINGGNLLRPYVVKYVSSSDGKIIRENRPLVIRRVSSESLSQTIKSLLEGVVEEGTGKRARIRGYSLGGKTGTAQIPASNGRGYLPNKYIASFMGFAPVDSPRIAGIVIIKEPTGAYYGGEVAAPLFRRIMKRVLPYLNILPQKEELIQAKEKLPSPKRNLKRDLTSLFSSVAANLNRSWLSELSKVISPTKN